MKFSAAEKAKLVSELTSEPNKVERLRELGIPSSTYYAWKLRVALRSFQSNATCTCGIPLSKVPNATMAISESMREAS